MKIREPKDLQNTSPITQRYFTFIAKHVSDVANGVVPAFMELNQIAIILNISHAHLTDTIQKDLGNHPCYFYDEVIIETAKNLLHQDGNSVANVARMLTYDPSNFSKFFKKWTGFTPGEFQKLNP